MDQQQTHKTISVTDEELSRVGKLISAGYGIGDSDGFRNNVWVSPDGGRLYPTPDTPQAAIAEAWAHYQANGQPVVITGQGEHQNRVMPSDLIGPDDVEDNGWSLVGIIVLVIVFLAGVMFGAVVF